MTQDAFRIVQDLALTETTPGPNRAFVTMKAGEWLNRTLDPPRDLSQDEARALAREALDYGLAHFAPPGSKPIQVYLTESDHRALKVLAAQRGTTVSEIVRAMITAELKHGTAATGDTARAGE